jgi:hypothetical protein
MELGEKLEGTMVLEGLLQGRVPPMGDVAERLREWVTFVGKLGPRFNLEIRGPQFSMLPDDRPFPSAGLGVGPEHGLTQALEQLAGLFGPGPERSQLFSTLRSSEYRKGLEVQTVYSIADGKVRAQTRSVEAETTAPPDPITTRQKVKMGLVGVGMAVLLLGAAMLFPGVRAMVFQVFETSRPFDAAELTIETGPYAEWLTISVDPEKSHRRGATLVVKRTKTYPLTEADLDAAAAAVEKSIRRRMALENLVRRQVRIECFDRDGKLVAERIVSVADLANAETESIFVPFPERTLVGRIALAP